MTFPFTQPPAPIPATTSATTRARLDETEAMGEAALERLDGA